MKWVHNIFLKERNIMTVILFNAVIIFLMYFPQYENNLILAVIDNVFILFFVIEAIVKIHHLKPHGYFSSGWNRFDFLIVAATLPTLLEHVIPVPDTSLIIILRLFRLIRLIRFVRFIPNVTKVMSGLGRALKASVFVLMAMVVLNFLLALITCHFYGDLAEEYFGNPLVALYSIFQLFTLEGWNEIAAVIIDRTDNIWVIGFTRIYFVIIVLIGGIFGMSLANAIFVDEMTMDNNLELEAKIDRLQLEIGELKQLMEQQLLNNEQSKN